MQTFLPYLDYTEAASCLDMKRLGKQRVETMQVLSALTGFRFNNESNSVEKNSKKGWINHPVSIMWRGRELELLSYQNSICSEWIARGYRDSCWSKSEKIVEAWINDSENNLATTTGGKPKWLTEELTSSHRAALLWKDPEWYSRFNWKEKAEYNYIWPHEDYPDTIIFR